ncbi:MAG: PRC-barrel domain-containing protein [Chloroflexia bacterium]|nr:PRC-barrel domain-containing protein [Chloroflexia bacterium]
MNSHGLRLTKGTTVVSLVDGAAIGAVERVYLDPTRKEIVGFTVHKGGFFGGTMVGLVEVGDVHAFGPDAVTIEDAAAIRSEFAVGARRDDLIELSSLVGRKVVTEDGVALGSVAGVRFGEESFRLLALDVSPGPLQEHHEVAGAAVATIGDDLIVVAEERAAAETGARPVPDRLVYVVEPEGAGRRLAG